MRPTRSGLLTAATTAALIGIAWLLGLPEVAIVAVGAGAVIALAALIVGMHRASLGVRRVVTPARITDGERGEVHLRITNTARLTSPVVSVSDDAGEHGTARLLLAPIPAGSTVTGRYSMPTARRGLHTVGPMRVTREDVFGLVRRDHVVDEITTFIVWPRIHPLVSLPPAPGDEPEHSTRSPLAAAAMDEEFASLRDYVAGDDIRRIHWAATARRGTPVVRHFEQPWLRRVTVLVDQRATDDDAAFERVVSATASILQLAARSGVLFRLVTSDGGDTGFIAAEDSAETLTDELAVLQPVAATAAATAGAASLAESLSGEAGWLLGLTAGAATNALSAVARSPSGRILCTAHRVDADPSVGAWDGSRPLDEVWSELLDDTSVRR